MSLVQRVLGRLVRSGGGRLLILTYDRVGEEFSWQMKQVTARYKPVALSRLMGHLGGKNPLLGPQVCVSLCIDEERDRQSAMSVMQQLGMSGTWFVPFESINRGIGGTSGQSPVQWDWAKIREVLAGGSEIAHRYGDVAVHGDTHRRSHLSALRARTEQESGVRVHAIGFRTDALARDRTLIFDAAIAGFNLGVETTVGVNSLRSLDPMMLKSVAVAPDLPRARFLTMLDALERGT